MSEYIAPIPFKVLDGHISQETAYVVTDYPWGFKLRCQKRFWIETKKGRGQRVVSQTTNPKKTNEFDVSASKPKYGIYSDIVILFLDENGHVHNDAVSLLSGYYENIVKFYHKYWALMSESQRERFRAGFQYAERRFKGYWEKEDYYNKYGIMDLS